MGVFNFSISGSVSGGGQRGPRGVAGRGISDIQILDNNDGSVQLTINYDDGSPPTIATVTLVSDTLIDLNKLELSGTQYTDKLTVKDNTEKVIFNVDTINNQINLENLYIQDFLTN